MDAVNSTFTSLLGRMAYETKREVTWEEMVASGECGRRPLNKWRVASGEWRVKTGGGPFVKAPA